MGKYTVKCDECKKKIKETNDITESYAGGRCASCRRKGSTIFGKVNGKMVLIATQTHKTLWD